MRLSLQRLGDNPRDIDRDTASAPLPAEECDVAGLRADCDTRWESLENGPPTEGNQENGARKPWMIYPAPPPPHWHPTRSTNPPSHIQKKLTTNSDASARKHVSGFEEFDFASCDIPGLVPDDGTTDGGGWDYAIDERGVYQVYASSADGMFCSTSPRIPVLTHRRTESASSKTQKPVFEIPSIREYFMDLDYVLSVISDGPTKSYAYRRLKYLAGKFSMYMLLNEDEETAQMKVCFPSIPLCSEAGSDIDFSNL